MRPNRYRISIDSARGPIHLTIDLSSTSLETATHERAEPAIRTMDPDRAGDAALQGRDAHSANYGA
jgi:hypothetical protein